MSHNVYQKSLGLTAFGSSGFARK